MDEHNHKITPIDNGTSPSEPNKPFVRSEDHQGLKGVFSTLLILLAAPLIALLFTSFVFQTYEVDGPSMQNTLQNHDRLIVLKLPRSLARLNHKTYVPNRGDIIIFNRQNLTAFGETGTRQLIKRVVGLPGDRVVVRDGQLTIFNQQHPNGYHPDESFFATTQPVFTPGDVDTVIGKGQVFVDGDNRTNSLDSRSFGPVVVSDIVGKLVLRVYPINKAQSF